MMVRCVRRSRESGEDRPKVTVDLVLLGARKAEETLLPGPQVRIRFRVGHDVAGGRKVVLCEHALDLLDAEGFV